MNVEYTAAMEVELDQIEEGTDNLLNTLNQFWKKFKKDLDAASKEPEKGGMENIKGKEEPTDEKCDKCGSPMVIKWGRYGKFMACSNYPECKNTRQIEGGEGAPEVHGDVAKEVCPNHAQPMVLKKGRFGPFLACPNYPDCKVTKRLVRGEGGKLQVEALKPIDENCPECGKPLMWRRGRFGPFIACSDYPSRRRKRARSACSARSAARARSSSGRAAGGACSTAAAATRSAASPRTTGRCRRPAPIAAAPTCWRRRPRRKARSSSAATRPATTSAPPDAERRATVIRFSLATL
jgi:DNA topoisomerase-1